MVVGVEEKEEEVQQQQQEDEEEEVPQCNLSRDLTFTQQVLPSRAFFVLTHDE